MKTTLLSLKTFIFVSLLLIISNNIFAQCSCPNNLVLNPSFESGSSNWSFSGGNLNIGGGAIVCGVTSGDFQITNNSSNYVSQTIASGTIAEGSTINATVYAGTHNNTLYHEVAIYYYNSSWGYISSSAVEVNKQLSNAPVGPELYTISSIVPVGTYFIKVGCSGNGDYIKMDNWCATVTAPCDNVTSGGTIGSDETFCGASFDPALINNLTSPSGGSGSLEYMWLSSTDNSTFYTIAGATSSTYDPSTITQTTWFLRCSRRVGCSSWAGESNKVMKEVSNCCSNVTNGGTIGSNESFCGNSFDPAIINSLVTPSGGTGALEFMWLLSLDGSSFSQIVGASGETYDPPTITQSTWFMRCSRRVGCISWAGESNIIKKELTFCAPTLSCSGNNKFNWTQTIDPLTGSNGTSAVRFICGSTQTYTISTLPAIFNSPLSVRVSDAVSFDGYIGRTSTGYQANEKWRVVFMKNGNVVYATPYTGDIADGVEQASWQGALGVNTFLPNGADQIILEHYCQANGTSSGPNSVVPMGICIEYNGCPTANAGSNITTTCTTPSGIIGTTSVVDYTYSWSPATGLSATNIAQPTANPTSTTIYTLTVGSVNSNCTATSTVTVNVNKAQPSANAGSNLSLTCVANNGFIGSSAIAGNTYSWSPASGLSATNVAMPNASPTTTTIYTLTVTGSNGCTATSTVLVSINSLPPVANAGTNITTTCLIPSGIIGTSSIAGNSYSWSPNLGLNNTTIAQPIANPTVTTTYTVTVTGTNGCTSTSSVTVNVNKVTPSINVGPNKTTTCTNPIAIIGTTGVVGNSYSWSPASGLNDATLAQPTANPSSTTIYTLTVTGSNGCSTTSSLTVTVDKTPPAANAGSNLVTTCTNPSTTIGTAGIVGNNYSWSPASGLSNSSIAQPVANPTTTTTYTLTVTAANGCTSTSTMTVTVNKTPPTANAGSNQTINCLVTTATLGSAPINNVSYSWSPATGLSATNVAQPIANPTANTIYTLTITSTNGCTATSTVTVTVDKTNPTANAGSNQTNTCLSPSSTIGVTSVVGNTYSWSPASGLSATNIAQPIANPTSNTTYTLTVTSANGCTATSSVTITVNKTIPTANAGTDKEITCSIASATIGTSAQVGNSYSWLPTSGLNNSISATPTASPITTTVYTVTVTNANSGCSSTSSVTVNVNKTNPVANAGNNSTVTCSNPSVTLGTAGILGNSYNWTPSNTLNNNSIAQPIASPNAQTTYQVTVTGTNGCTSTSNVTISVNKTPPTANAGSNIILNCNTTSGTIGTTPIVGNTYSWSPLAGLNNPNAAQPIASPTSSTQYTVTVTGANGCTATSTVSVTLNTTPPPANAGNNVTLTCSSPSATIGTLSGGGFTYSWTPGIGLSATNIPQPLTTATVTTVYTITVTASNGCTSSSSVTVTVNKDLPIANAGNPIDVCSTTSGTIGTQAIAGNSYSWSPSTGLNATNIAQPTANPTTTTTYTVTVTNTNGCTSTSSVTVNFKEGSVGNFVWNDLNADGIFNENPAQGINGVSIELWTPGNDNIQGNNDDVVLETTTTATLNNNPGYYNFKICNTGNYYIKFPTTTNATTNLLTQQSSAAGTDNNSDGNQSTGLSTVFNINVDGSGIAKNNNTIDAGYYPLMSVGNVVWNDINKDGIKQSSESGIVGASVNIYNDANSDGIPDGAAIGTTTTGANGLYIFNGLKPGNYIVGVTPPAPASGNPYTTTPVNESDPNSNVDNNDNGLITVSGETRSGTITLAAGTEPTGETPNNSTAPDANSNLTIDFGFYQAVNISGNVLVDNNGATNVDGTGIGSPSSTQVYANLVNSLGNVVAVVPVNSNGTYEFTDVQPNTSYTMVLSTTQGTVGNPAPVASLPNGWSNVSEDCCDNTGNDGTTNGVTSVSVGTTNVSNVNFGITQPLSVGNVVWNDINKDGIKQSSESGIVGASVNIYNDANSDGIPDGAAIANTTTGANGLYIFNGLKPGNYIVGVTPPANAGSVPTSSSINETNPNLNIDNNDNGIVTVGTETRSGTIILSAGDEPAGETPNNSSAPDANSNLTIDFGFFDCPNNFEPDTAYVCNGGTYNLTTYEPVGFTGGNWTFSGNSVANPTSVSQIGIYTYTYINGTCSASGILNLQQNVPDYTPTIAIEPGAITGNANVRVIITINELLNRTPCSPVFILVPRLEPRFTFQYDPAASVIGGIPVTNTDWQFFNTNPLYYIWKYVGNNEIFPANGTSKLGFIGLYVPGGTDGVSTFSVQIFQGSGGETNQTNNTSSNTLIYFR